MGESEQEARSIVTHRRVVLALVVVVGLGLVTGAVFAVGRVRSLDSEIAASETNSNDLQERIASLEEQLAETRAALDEQQTVGASGRVQLEALERENQALENCATEAHPRGRPRVELVPPNATPGSRVEVVGHCFTSPFWRARKATKGIGMGLWTMLDGAGNPDPSLQRSSCELVAGRTGTFEIGDDGRMRGRFVVPRRGKCVGSEESNAMVPGRYNLIVGCRQCSVAPFQVVTPSSERARLPECSARDWSLSLGDVARAGGVVVVGLNVDPDAGARCRLRREATVTLTRVDGTALFVDGNPVQATVDGVVGDEIVALWAWSNWCGSQTSFSIRATIGAKTSSRALGAGPRCDFQGRPSVLRALPQWTKGVNP